MHPMPPLGSTPTCTQGRHDDCPGSGTTVVGPAAEGEPEGGAQFVRKTCTCPCHTTGKSQLPDQ